MTAKANTETKETVVTLNIYELIRLTNIYLYHAKENLEKDTSERGKKELKEVCCFIDTLDEVIGEFTK